MRFFFLNIFESHFEDYNFSRYTCTHFTSYFDFLRAYIFISNFFLFKRLKLYKNILLYTPTLIGAKSH